MGLVGYKLLCKASLSSSTQAKYRYSLILKNKSWYKSKGSPKSNNYDMVLAGMESYLRALRMYHIQDAVT